LAIVFRGVAEHVYQNQQPYHRVEMIISQKCHTPTLINDTCRHAHTPCTEPMQLDNHAGHNVVAHPRQQHRRSRSLTEVWLEHRPQGTLPTGRPNRVHATSHNGTRRFIVETLLQPKFSKKVSTQKVPAKDEIVRTTKYVLTHQNLDAQGEIVTDFVKVNYEQQ
jgi:hypothetical protein